MAKKQAEPLSNKSKNRMTVKELKDKKCYVKVGMEVIRKFCWENGAYGVKSCGLNGFVVVNWGNLKEKTPETAARNNARLTLLEQLEHQYIRFNETRLDGETLTLIKLNKQETYNDIQAAKNDLCKVCRRMIKEAGK